MKLSDYPEQTFVHVSGRGIFCRYPTGWVHTDRERADRSYSLDEMDRLQEENDRVKVHSVPWGVTQALMDVAYELYLNNDYDVPDLNNGPESALEEAFRRLDKAKVISELQAEEKRRDESNSRIAELKRRMEES